MLIYLHYWCFDVTISNVAVVIAAGLSSNYDNFKLYQSVNKCSISLQYWDYKSLIIEHMCR